MTNEKVKRMFDACYKAKRIREMLPDLPQGIMPSYIQYMDVIQSVEKQGGRARISDISEKLKIPRPGVTRTLKEMEKKGLLQKVDSLEDGRVTYLLITEKGKELSKKYDENYFRDLSLDLDEINEEDADCMINTIDKLYNVMYERSRREYRGK